MKAGRNDPCPCGSGKKFKKCCYAAISGLSGFPDTFNATDKDPSRDQINQIIELLQSGKHAESEKQAQALLASAPDSAKAWKVMGVLLHALKKDAIPALSKAVELAPDDAEAYYNLGNALKELGRFDDAVANYLRALAIKPDYAEAYGVMGAALTALGQLDAALASLRLAQQFKPDYAEAYNDLGNALQGLGLIDEAVLSYRRALDIKPDFHLAYSNILFTLNYHPDLSAEEIYRTYQEYDAIFGIPLRSTWRPHTNDKSPNRRLRIGYVSPDFRKHSLDSFLQPLLSGHDKAQVEVYAYAGLNKEDEVTAAYKEHVEHWIPTKGMGDEALAERIRTDGIDVLVDLAGHTADNRLSVFARKPAPVSVSTMGFGYTTGLSAIDYFLIDAAAVPQGSDHLFSEQIWRLPTPAFPYGPAPGMGEVGDLPALQRGYVTFGTLSRSVRINHRTIRVWAALLNTVPDSRLVIDSLNFKDPVMQEKLTEKFSAYGINPERLEIGFHTPPWDVLRSIDISLDCFPHNSGTTLIESLHMGVPFITLAGRPSVGQLGACILRGIGHPELIAASEAEYVEKAAQLANNLTRLTNYRSTLRSEIERSVVFVETSFVRKLEDAYRQMWQRWCTENTTHTDTQSGIEDNIASGDTDSQQQSLQSSIDQTIQLAIAHHQAEKYQEAESLYSAILKISPTHPDANHNLAVLLTQNKHPEVALPHFLAALNVEPTRGQYWLSYIDALIQTGQTKEAQQTLTLARQQGLQGEAVDALSAKISGNNPTQITSPARPAVLQKNKKTPVKPENLSCPLAPIK